MNADVILNRLSVRDGRLVLPDGMSYKVLVIPDYVTQMTLPLLRKLRDLVEAGGVLSGGEAHRLTEPCRCWPRGGVQRSGGETLGHHGWFVRE